MGGPVTYTDILPFILPPIILKCYDSGHFTSTMIPTNIAKCPNLCATSRFSGVPPPVPQNWTPKVPILNNV